VKKSLNIRKTDDGYEFEFFSVSSFFERLAKELKQEKKKMKLTSNFPRD
jgi:hypothetical protein